MITNEYYLSLNYKFVTSTPKSLPSDYKEYYLLDLGHVYPNDNMHTVSLRLGRDYYLFNRLNWHVELGPSLIFIEKIYLILPMNLNINLMILKCSLMLC